MGEVPLLLLMGEVPLSQRILCGGRGTVRTERELTDLWENITTLSTRSVRKDSQSTQLKQRKASTCDICRVL